MSLEVISICVVPLKVKLERQGISFQIMKLKLLLYSTLAVK